MWVDWKLTLIWWNTLQVNRPCLNLAYDVVVIEILLTGEPECEHGGALVEGKLCCGVFEGEAEESLGPRGAFLFRQLQEFLKIWSGDPRSKEGGACVVNVRDPRGRQKQWTPKGCSQDQPHRNVCIDGLCCVWSWISNWNWGPRLM